MVLKHLLSRKMYTFSLISPTVIAKTSSLFTLISTGGSVIYDCSLQLSKRPLDVRKLSSLSVVRTAAKTDFFYVDITVLF